MQHAEAITSSAPLAIETGPHPIAVEMAETQKDLGYSLTLKDWVGLGYAEDVARKHAPEASAIFARTMTKRVA